MRYSYKKDLVKLIEWVKINLSCDVILNHDDASCVIFDEDAKPKKIFIENSFSNEKKIFLLLHEIGHCMLRLDWGYFSLVLGYLHEFESGKISRVNKINYYVSCLEEEYKAWEIGYTMGLALGVNINIVKWDSFKSKCIMGYMLYYSNICKDKV